MDRPGGCLHRRALMGDNSGIEWCNATWNPVTGCSKVSPGCAHCYAERMALTRLTGKPGYPGLPWTPENAKANVVLRPDRLDQPLRWRRPRRIFVNSMSDLFHERVPFSFIDQVFAVMGLADWHTFQVLTKRPERMRQYVAERRHHIDQSMLTLNRVRHGYLVHHVEGWPFGNVWLGTSIENDRFVGRADALRATPAAVRFISAEPLLGPLPSLDLTGIDWLIVGGESGSWESPGRRSRKGRSLVERCVSRDHVPGTELCSDPRHEEHGDYRALVPRPERAGWVRELRDKALDADVAFMFKQWGGPTSKAGGRLLDGETWSEYPEERA
jgi:protein gp37